MELKHSKTENKLVKRLEDAVDVCREDEKYTNMEMIGALEIIKLDLYQEILEG